MAKAINGHSMADKVLWPSP